jgi:hypothetical protein
MLAPFLIKEGLCMLAPKQRHMPKNAFVCTEAKAHAKTSKIFEKQQPKKPA